jgi:hypothetical protein
MGALAVATFLGACGDDVTRGGLSDEDYLRVFCTDLSAFSNALVRAQNPDAIRTAIADYVEQLRTIEPPDDLRGYHEAYITYLQDAAGEPSLVGRKPPTPPGGPRDRLAAKESSVSACKDASFFSQPAGAD